MPSHAQRVCIAGLVTPMRWAITRGIARTTGISALGECPRHWYQCQGQARPALTLLLIRVGDFKTRLEAMKFLKEIQSLYSAAFIVKDDVKLPE